MSGRGATGKAFVLDASVTATWLLPDEHDVASQRVYAQLRAARLQFHAPELWLWECGNIVANGVKRSRIAAADAVLVWSVLDAIRTRVELASFEPAQARACLLLAVDESLSIHDAAYLWLSMSLQVALLTHDAALARAAARQRVPVLRLEDLA